MDDKAKAFLDDLRRLMAAHKAQFDLWNQYDGNGDFCGTDWWIHVGDCALALSDVDRYVSTPTNEQVEKVQATGNAMKTLSESMRKDPSYAWTWHCNLACCAFDEGVDIIRANNIAARFMAMAFSIVRAQYDPGMTKENTP